MAPLRKFKPLPKRNNFIPVFVLLSGFQFFYNAQAQEPVQNDSNKIHDLNTFLKKGEFHGQVQSFFIMTDNEKPLTDHYAWAAGAGLTYRTASWKGLQAGISGSFMMNIRSSDLSKPDSLTGAMNRYEILMFDYFRPSARQALPRLEQLYLQYNFRNSYIQAGKFILNTPFLNKQEGKMPPNVEEGLWMKFSELKNVSLEAGWVWSILSRGTTRWLPAAKTPGIYPSGSNPDGSKSAYYGNLESKGIGLAGLMWHPGNLTISFWNQYTENIMNSALLSVEYGKSFHNANKVFAGVMLIRQDAIHDGGNPEPAKSYLQPGSRSNSLSARLAFGRPAWNITLSYTRITPDGRYQNPREWSYDPFYTFMQRELTEGCGNLHALTVKGEVQNRKKNFRSVLTYGRYFMPDVKNSPLNKYGMPSFQQVNLDFRYSPAGRWSGINMIVLLVYKDKTGAAYGNYKYIINKVNLVNYNVALEIGF